MNLAEFLSVETSIEPNLESTDRRGVLVELAGILQRRGKVAPETDLVAILENREKLGSTGIGEGVAIPHVRLPGVEAIRIALGRSGGGVEFDALDDCPVHLFFLLVAPEKSAGEHLKALARISRILKRKSARQSLMEASGAAEMMSIIASEDERE